MASPVWQPVEIPPIPPKIRKKFVAHSVVATGDPSIMFGRTLVRWKDVKDVKTNVETNLGKNLYTFTRGAFTKDAATIEGLSKELGCDSGNRVVALSSGTLINVGTSTDSGGSFAGFAKDESRFYIPSHRFLNSHEGVKHALYTAQKDWETWSQDASKEDVNASKKALGQLASMGYPQPGMDESDGNVVKMWAHTTENKGAALVKLRKFPENIGVLIVVEKKYVMITEYGGILNRLVDTARDAHRNDFLCTAIDGVFTAK